MHRLASACYAMWIAMFDVPLLYMGNPVTGLIAFFSVLFSGGSDA